MTARSTRWPVGSRSIGREGRGRRAGGRRDLAGCRSTPPPGTGWSRAPDLSVYSAMLLYADIARQQSILCGGFSTASVEDHWRRDFGRRAPTPSRPA